jgi:hypothetical protein
MKFLPKLFQNNRAWARFRFRGDDAGGCATFLEISVTERTPFYSNRDVLRSALVQE